MDKIAEFEIIRKIITTIRQIRGEYGISNKQVIPVILYPKTLEMMQLILEERLLIEHMAKCNISF